MLSGHKPPIEGKELTMTVSTPILMLTSRENRRCCVYAILIVIALSIGIGGCGGASSSTTSPTPTPVQPASPVFTSISPASGFAGGGTPLIITGTDFRSGVTVTIGGSVISSPLITGSTSIAITAPAHAAGPVDIVIKNADATSVTATGAYTFLANAAPTVTSATPASIAAGSSNTSMTINGTGFTSQSVVQFNATTVTSQFVSDHQLTATIPANLISDAELGRLTVSNPAPGGGSSDTGPAFAVGPTLPTAAYGQTVTVLQDGRILICGGLNGNTTLNSAAIYDPATNTISKTGSMTSQRYVHTATLLSNGKVLIAGGTDDNNPTSPLSTAELFDPKTGSFSATSPMVNHRAIHTATILPSGKVLLAGGYGYSEENTAEVFDPATNTFAAASLMTAKRGGHSAVALANGTVLIMGGVTPCSLLVGFFCYDRYLSSAEVYDPSTNSFTATGSMHVGRRLASTVVLKNNKVFVVGGADELGSGPIMASTVAETYDPATKQFLLAGSSAIGFWNGTIVLLADGRVLVCGGHDSVQSFGFAQLYDPTSQTVSVIPGMNTPRLAAGSALLPSGAALIVGGTSDLNAGLSSTEIFSPSNLATEFALPVQNPTPTLTQVSPATTVVGTTTTLSGSGFNSQSEVLINGESVPYTLNTSQQLQIQAPALYGTYSIAVTNPAPGGGLSSSLQQLSHVDISVDPQSPQVLPSSATYFTVNVLGGGSYTSSIREGSAGGTFTPGNDGHWLLPNYIAPSTPGTYHIDYASTVDPKATATATINVSNSPIHASSISLQASHSTGLSAIKLSSGKILVTGGGTGNLSTSAAAEVFDPTLGSSTLVGAMALARAGHTSTSLGGGLALIAGGVTPGSGGTTSPTSATEVFDSSTLAFSAGPSLTIPRNGHFAIALPTGDILVAGGCTSASATTTEVYRAGTKSFQTGPTLKSPHCNGQATLLSSGQVLFTGGTNPTSGAIATNAELYDPTANALTLVGSLIDARSEHTATLLADGRVLLAGGYSSASGTLSSTEFFDPATKVFSQGPALVHPREDHAAVQLASAGLFIAGGRKVVSPSQTPSTQLEMLGNTTSAEVAILNQRINPTALPLSGSSFALFGGALQTVDVVTIGTAVANPPAPSISSCIVSSGSYFTCDAYDLQTPLTVIIDGTTYTATPASSNGFSLSTYPTMPSNGSHTIQVQNPNGKSSNAFTFTF
jgi:hypothetical protein